MKLAATGGTGFVGSHFVNVALEAGHEVTALTRRKQEPRERLRWIEGSLDRPESLRDLVKDADAVIHIAGVLNPRDPADFERGNVQGTLAMLAAATAAGVTRFVHVSSLAAREPKLSNYGGSKARAEELVERSGLDWAMVRPPAVYGPGDRETLDLFKWAKAGLMLLPPHGRVSVIHVDDLARLLLRLAEAPDEAGVLYEPDDGRPGGWTHKQLAKAIGRAVGRRNLSLSMPGPMLKLGAVIDQLVRREKAKLSADRAAYFSHRDWSVDPAKRPAESLWRPQVETESGLRATSEWYRQKGWL
ncbi:MAG TPA: NAD-dependent epimerase/dehydratase family protein [Sphingomicrobium sp.]|nr:NAD-dependent epimerase/dehydratase family protein [Sphingomicrobium sp.]